MRSCALVLSAIVLCGMAVANCTRSNPRPAAAAPTPEPKVVHLIATPSQAWRDTEPTWTPEPELVPLTPTAAPTVPPAPTKRPTLDISSIPSLEHPVGGRPFAGRTAAIGSLQFDQSDFKYPVYIERVVLIISLNWYKPVQSVQRSPVVHFQIERDGTITDPWILVSSGLAFVDKAALRAVLASSPLPPLPADYSGAHLGIQVVFE